MAECSWLSVATLLIFIIAVRGEEFQCTNQITEYCSCSKSTGDYEIDCPPQDVSVIVSFKPRESIRIICSLNIEIGHWNRTVQYLSGLQLGKVKSFIVKSCPGLPNISFKELMDTIGVTDVSSFHMIHMLLNSSDYLSRDHLKGLENIKQLDLSFNKLSNIPEDLFADMPQLTWLDLKNNKLKLPKNIFKPIPKLEVLELGSNNLTFLEPGIFRNLTRLRLLNLWGNRLQNLTRHVFTDIPNLESLDLNSNHMVSMAPDLLSDLPNLKCLNLYKNDFFSLPQKLFSSNLNLEKIQINHNRRTLRIPPGFLSNLPHLKEVKMTHSNLSHLPEDLFYGSKSLTNLTLKFNSITHIPEDLFRDNDKLQSIDLSQNKLNRIPSRMFRNLNNLVVLNLSSNNISHINESTLTGLSKLIFLNLEYNNIEYVHQLAFHSTSKLVKINLSHNKLRTFKVNVIFQEDSPGEFSPLYQAVNLEEINLSYNNLTKIYDDWNNKVKIKKIDLSHNAISEVYFENLIYNSESPILDLSYNNISVIYFENAEILSKELNRSYNPLKLRLSRNPISCDCKANSLVRYLRKEMDPSVYSIVEIDPVGLSCKESYKELSKIDPKILTCKNDKDCPNFCRCFYRPYDTALIVDCSSAGYISPPDLNFISIQVAGNVNQTIVDLSNNTISTLPANFNSIGYNKTTKLNLSHNKLVNISKTVFNPNLQELYIDNNNLTRLDNDVIHKAKQLKKITLSGNPWNCNCEAKHLLHFMLTNYAKVGNLRNVTCSNGMNMSNMTIIDLCPTSNLIIGLSSLIIALLGLIIGGLFALYYRYQREIKVWLYAHNVCLWFVTEEELDKDKQYDAFISFSHQDEDFIANKLVPGLENGSTKYKLCLHYRDWVVGDFIPKQIARSVQESKRTVIVLSPAFIESVWGLMEFRTAHQQALSEGRSRVIVILYGDVGPTDKFDPELKAYLSMNTYVKWGDPWFWEKLRYALPHPVKNQNLPLTTMHETKPLKNGSTPTINSNTIDAPKAV